MPHPFTGRLKPATPPLRRHDAAAYIRTTYGMPCSPPWLAKLAVVGGGPSFHKAGRTPLYAVEDLDAWALARLGTARSTTQEHKGATDGVVLTPSDRKVANQRGA